MAATRRSSTRRPRRRATKPILPFLGQTHRAVRSHLAATTDLPTFLASAGELTLGGRRRLVEQALVLMEENYAHRPLKESMHGIDPVQRLRLLRHRLEQSSPSTMGSEYEFHREMLEIFGSLRDLHTNYLLPSPFDDKVAFLPFDIEEYFVDRTPHWIATHFMQGFAPRHFKPGVEITSWSGVPIARAIDVIASQHAGSNLSARHARGVDGLTLRALRRTLPPDELFVLVGYLDLDGTPRELRQDWLVSPPLPDPHAVDADALSLPAASQGLDLEMDIIRRMKGTLFAPGVLTAARRTRKTRRGDRASSEDAVASAMPDVLSARRVTTAGGTFGYIRIFTFNVDEPAAFVNEFIRLAEQLPQHGLILDVRGNGGGHIWASEGLLQILTPYEIEPEPTQFINTALNHRICRRHHGNPVGIELGPWVTSIAQATQTGAVYSRGFPITPPEFANAWGQRYHGPVVLVTDARCYSATDIFAAGFQDHQIGPVLGVDDNTGAGGANVWTHGLLRELLRLPSPVDRASPYRTLPRGAGMRVSVRRTLRVGEQSGTPVEDLGVTPDHRHYMTKNDLLGGNVDLIDTAGRLLARRPVRELSATTSQAGRTLTITATTRGLSRIDTYLDGRPVETTDVGDGTLTYTVDLPDGAETLELAGYEDDSYVAARRIAL